MFGSQKALRFKEISALEGVEEAGLLHYPVRVGGAAGARGFLVIGRRAIYVFRVDGVHGLIWFDRGDLLAVEVAKPDLPYVMNLNVAGVLANALTEHQAGLELIIHYQENEVRTDIFVLGGLKADVAYDCREKIDQFLINSGRSRPSVDDSDSINVASRLGTISLADNANGIYLIHPDDDEGDLITYLFDPDNSYTFDRGNIVLFDYDNITEEVSNIRKFDV